MRSLYNWFFTPETVVEQPPIYTVSTRYNADMQSLKVTITWTETFHTQNIKHMEKRGLLCYEPRLKLYDAPCTLTFYAVTDQSADDIKKFFKSVVDTHCLPMYYYYFSGFDLCESSNDTMIITRPGTKISNVTAIGRFPDDNLYGLSYEGEAFTLNVRTILDEDGVIMARINDFREHLEQGVLLEQAQGQGMELG